MKISKIVKLNKPFEKNLEEGLLNLQNNLEELKIQKGKCILETSNFKNLVNKCVKILKEEIQNNREDSLFSYSYFLTKNDYFDGLIIISTEMRNIDGAAVIYDIARVEKLNDYFYIYQPI